MGEKALKAHHLETCGKVDGTDTNESVKKVAFCIQSSSLKSNPHEIRGDISVNGEIKSMTCSCVSGQGELCKHILATLLYCHA